MESQNSESAEKIIYDYRTAELSPDDILLCDFAVKLTLNPGGMAETDVVLLESVGFSHKQINIAVQVIGYFNYINRVADGLGVEPEEWMTVDEAEWKQAKARFVK